MISQSRLRLTFTAGIGYLAVATLLFACQDQTSLGGEEKVPTAPNRFKSSVRPPTASAPSPRASTLRTPNPKRLAELEARRSTPEFAASFARHQRIANRPALAFAFVEGTELPEGVVAVVRLGQPGPLPRYVVVSATRFDDEIMMRAKLAVFSHEMQHEDDDSPVEITLRLDGGVDIVSGKYGSATRMQRGRTADKTRNSAPILAKMNQGATLQIPRFGTARVVSQ
jgi:hypothetical protein